jgi:hypothetical protein
MKETIADAEHDRADAETGEILDKGKPALPAIAGTKLPETAGPNRVPNVMPVTSFGKLAEAIATVMLEIAENPIHKAGRNAFHNYNYARMQDILNGLTPLMAKHGIAIMQTEVERGFMDNGNAIFATYDFTIIHKSGEVWPFPQRQTGVSNTRTSKGTFDDKGLNKCHTSARKYFLLSLFQIPTTDEEDADRGDNDGYRGAPPPKDKPAAPPLKKVTPQTPHEIPRPAGIKAVDWGRALVEQFKLCQTPAALDGWLASNDKALEELEKLAPQVHERVMDVEKTRREELAK